MTKNTRNNKNTSEQEPPSPPGALDTDGEGGRNESPGDIAAPVAPPGHQAGSAQALEIARAALAGHAGHAEIRNGRLAQIALRIDDVLGQGAAPDALRRYLAANLDDVDSPSAVLLHRLNAEQLPAALFPAPGATGATAPHGRREWCGKDGCNPVTRQIEIDDPTARSGIRIKRCPTCHPLGVALPTF